jgi:hypothetical protein
MQESDSQTIWGCLDVKKIVSDIQPIKWQNMIWQFQNVFANEL